MDNVLNTESLKQRSNSDNIESTVTDRHDRFRRKGHIVHLCELELPKGAVVKRNDEYVASPELVFLELANELDIQRLIFLGLLMCAHRAGGSTKMMPANVAGISAVGASGAGVSGAGASGAGASAVGVSGAGVNEIPRIAITSKRELKEFIEKTSGHRGHRKAARAVKYIEDGAASLMEVLVFMNLRLPHLLGGYGLKGADFNHEIHLKKNDAKLLKQKRCFVDLYFSNDKLAVEYDSLKHHAGPTEQGKDLMRATALENLGISVIRMGTLQLYDRKAFLSLISNISSKLKKKIRIRTSKFKSQHKKLRQLLP